MADISGEVIDTVIDYVVEDVLCDLLEDTDPRNEIRRETLEAVMTSLQRRKGGGGIITSLPF